MVVMNPNIVLLAGDCTNHYLGKHLQSKKKILNLSGVDGFTADFCGAKETPSHVHGRKRRKTSNIFD